MSSFDPGDGWREVQSAKADEERLVHGTGADVRIWVRGEPVPALPTVPYTVIRPFWDTSKGSYSDDTLTLGEDGRWSGFWTSERVLDCITGFVVLSEPRAVTAKAVLDRLFEQIQGDGKVSGLALTAAMREFGVSS